MRKGDECTNFALILEHRALYLCHAMGDVIQLSGRDGELDVRSMRKLNLNC